MQIPLGDNVQSGEMESQIYQDRQQEVDRENLLERCAFVNGRAERGWVITLCLSD